MFGRKQKILEKILDKDCNYSYTKTKNVISNENNNIISGGDLIIDEENISVKKDNVNNIVIKGNHKSISIVNGTIIVDGKEFDKNNCDLTKTINITIEGNVTNIDTDCGDVTVKNDVLGNIDSNGSVTISGNVQGDIDSNGSVHVKGSVAGNVDANGSIHMSK